MSIYNSDTLRVEATVTDPERFRRSGCELVSFEPLARVAGREPFGARFANKYGLNALHIVPVGNDWYQYPDLDRCLKAVSERTAADATVYGSSMGAYAVTTYGDFFPGRNAIALSPQFSIRRESVPFEKRWATDAERISFRADSEGITQTCHLYILFDPRNPDAEHAHMIAERAAATLVEVPGGGHPVGPVLAEAGCLSTVILKILRGSPTRDDLLQIILPNVARSPLHHLLVAVNAPFKDRESHIRAGLALDPQHIKLRHALAHLLAAQRRYDEAIPHYEYVVKRRPAHPTYRAQYLRACVRSGVQPLPGLVPADSSPSAGPARASGTRNGVRASLPEE